MIGMREKFLEEFKKTLVTAFQGNVQQKRTSKGSRC